MPGGQAGGGCGGRQDVRGQQGIRGYTAAGRGLPRPRLPRPGAGDCRGGRMWLPGRRASRRVGPGAGGGGGAGGPARRIRARLPPRLSALFGSTPDQGPKAAKFAVLPPGHAGFPKRAERSEGSDTTPHPKHHLFRRVCPCARFFSESRVCTSRNFDRNGKDHAAQRGRDAFGTATRISASLSRRLSAFFRSVSDQDPKAAKFAVLPPGHAGFPNRVKRSEGSDTTPTSHVQKVLRTE